MNILFRTDINSSIGSGHLRRCLALAAALRQRGAKIALACSSTAMPSRELIAENVDHLFSIETTVLDRDFPLGWEAIPAEPAVQCRDAAATQAASDEFAPDIIVVDHYLLDSHWESFWDDEATLAIDDLANRSHTCEFLLDQTVSRSRSDYSELVSSGCNLILGSQFALLRNEFSSLRLAALEKRAQSTSIERVLVNFGGSDVGGMTEPAVASLLSLDPPIQIEVICGTRSSSSYRLDSLARDSRVKVRYDVKDMAVAMLEADIAVGAGGATAWERCALGLPTIVIPTAANQQFLSARLAEAGAAMVADCPEQMKRQISHVTEDFGRWHDMVAASAALCDGLGAMRVATELLMQRTGQIQVREAKPEDSLYVWAWRNDPLMRRMAENTTVVRLTDHQRWFKKVLEEPKQTLLVAEISGEPMGMVRFDIDDRVATVSINLAPAWRGKSLGRKLLSASLRRFSPIQRVDRLIARIRKENRASFFMFEECGFRLLQRDSEFVTLARTVPTDGVVDCA